MKKMICLLLAVLMIATVNIPARAASSNIGLEPGQEVPDFTVSLTDGTTAALSELLEEKELVVLNIFATWCAPCELEFPGMEKVYQANSDRMVILSVSGDPGDTMEMDKYLRIGYGNNFSQLKTALDIFSDWIKANNLK